MRALWGQDVFSVEGTTFRWEDVVLFAALRGDWADVVRRANDGLCLLAAAGGAEEPAYSDEELEAAANEFRYDRDLVTADETEAWLGQWGLDVDEWYSWVTIDLLRKRRDSEPVRVELTEANASPEEIATGIHAEAVCSRALTRLSYELAARAAIESRLEQERQNASAAASEEARPESETEPGAAGAAADLGGVVLPLSQDEARQRIETLVRLDRSYRRFAAGVVTPEGVEARVRAHQADWMRVRTQMLQLPNEDVAREALLSVREEGCSLEEVAADAGAEPCEAVSYLEELEPRIKDHLLAAHKGELLGPLNLGDGVVLILVLDKILPSSDDPVIAERARASLLKGAVSREVDNRVRWLWQS